ncbi:hypothetical protein IMZ11_41850, partial [Microtetraspora sp. AC03309]|uniref:hypothetical protein n=1 Tax=Microtetraspora sp. AC03309 TaxID=2779376 RepID=UPI001E651D81
MGESGQWKGAARQTGMASAGPGGYANSGIHIGDVHTTPLARSVYRDQVEQIFPWPLIGREAELAELAAFCAGGDDEGYVWWQGSAWAGKSALMATFVLKPPPGVRVVSFFITARYAGQSDRQAFLDVVLVQLAELLGQPLPPLLNSSTQQGWFNRLLKDATLACQEAGDRLVLVVDGLDEDRGVTVGPEAHSIAALLPAVVPEGLRVVVAGRPNPPVPSDVPARHPLRDRRIQRWLEPSPEARVIRDDALRELEYLLDGGPAERDLLGLLVAAGGGLSISDLADLTDSAVGYVEKQLRAVSGRTFSSRDSRWRPGAGAKVFVLAHEELQMTALESFSGSELYGFRNRIHAWAEGYRNREWPADTPEYLLRGYHRLLNSVGDLDRMVACATDQARLDRMLEVSGGDAAALAEILACQNIICEHDAPDLSVMLLLARAREHLADRNANIPIDLPAAWVTLGNPVRAEALARSISDLDARVRALTQLVVALADGSHLDHAHLIASHAETTARSITDPDAQAEALTQLVTALARIDHLDHAETIALSITDLDYQARALTQLVTALARIDHLDHAETTALSITNPYYRALALTELATALARTGRLDHAETTAHFITNPYYRARALTQLGITLARMNRLDHAETIALSITDLDYRARAL